MKTTLKEKNLEDLIEYMSYNIYGRTANEILDPFKTSEFELMSKEYFLEKPMPIMIGNNA